MLAYALGGGIVGLACYLGLIPFDPETLRFDGIVRRHLEIMTGAGIVAGLVYWMIAGRNAGALARTAAPADAPAAAAVAFAVTAYSASVMQKQARTPFHPRPPRLNPAP